MNQRLLDELERWLVPLRNRVLLMLARGMVRAVRTQDDKRRLQLELLADEETDNMEQMQEYGFASEPTAGAECLAVFFGGDRNNGMVVATDDPRCRPRGLNPGEVCLYHQSDALAEGEELAAAPEGAPAGWPAAPEDPEALPPGLCQLTLKDGRVINLTGARLELFATTQLSICAPSILMGPPGAQVEIGGGGEEEGRPVARLGDCVDVATGSSEGRWPIVGSCD